MQCWFVIHVRLCYLLVCVTGYIPLWSEFNWSQCHYRDLKWAPWRLVWTATQQFFLEILFVWKTKICPSSALEISISLASYKLIYHNYRRKVRLMSFYNDIETSKEDDQTIIQNLVVYLDIPKAFDTVDHTILVTKLSISWYKGVGGGGVHYNRMRANHPNTKNVTHHTCQLYNMWSPPRFYFGTIVVFIVNKGSWSCIFLPQPQDRLLMIMMRLKVERISTKCENNQIPNHQNYLKGKGK